MKMSHVRIFSRFLVITVVFSLMFNYISLDSYGATGKSIDLTDQIKIPKTPTIIENKNQTDKLQPVAPEVDSSASSWAIPEIIKAYEYGLTYSDIMNKFKQSITREEFCTVVVKLYEKLSKQTVTAGKSQFSDTHNPEIIKANQLGIVLGTGGGKFSPQLQITRQEISVMIFRALLKAVDNLDKSTDGEFNFDDRREISSWALEAMKYVKKHGILNGIGGNKIAPLNNTSRQEAIAILKRTYEAFMPGSSSGGSGNGGSSTDTGKYAGTGFSLGSGFRLDMGTGMSKLGYDAYSAIPDDVKSGIANVPGTNKKVKLIDGTVMVGLPNDSVKLTEEEKSKKYDRENRLAYPNYKTCLNLKVAMGSDKTSLRSSADGAALIDQDGVKKRWFSFDLVNATGAKKVVWQVSRTPFTGFKANWKAPVGLIKSGEVTAAAGEFMIDFAAFTKVPTAMDLYRIGSNGILTWGGDHQLREIPSSQVMYYVRAVPVDAAGNCIGDPGDGISVLYGKAITASGVRNLTLNPSFQLWSTQFQGKPHRNNVEFPNLFERFTSRGINCDYNYSYWCQLKGFDAASTKAVLQVSIKPFNGKLSNWEAPDGLVYTKTYDELPITQYYTGEWINAVPIDFSEFAPAAATFKPGEKMQYYVRAVALRPASSSGSIIPAFSETVAVWYGKPEAIKYLRTETHTVESYVPSIKILSYHPIVGEDPNWDKYYQVYRKPLWHEINCKFKSLNTGKILYPYSVYYFNYEEMGYDRAPTIEEYENVMIKEILDVNALVSIFPSEKDKSWWEDLWDGICDFFESLINIVMNVVNWASSAYNGLKSGLINFVASTIPVPGLKGALELLVNAGLMALGLPPTLPNFDQLCEQGLGYLAEVALTQAGLTANEITTQLLADTANAIGGEVTKSYKKEAPNPIESPFLKNHPDYLEQPAYLEIELSNPYSKASLPGSFNVDIEWPHRENIGVTSDMGIAPQNQIAFINHIAFGLMRGNTGGYPINYPVFKALRNQKIPTLKPGAKCVVKVYLEPYYGMPYPFAAQGDAVTQIDFFQFYFGRFGELNFNVYTDSFMLPDPEAVEKAKGFIENADTIYSYKYDRISSGSSFKGLSDEAYRP